MLPLHVLRALDEVMNSLVKPDTNCDIGVLTVRIYHVLVIVWHFAFLSCLCVGRIAIFTNSILIAEQSEDLLNEEERIIEAYS